MAGSSVETVPKFDLEAPRFDQSTYMGRLSHFLQVSDCGGGRSALCCCFCCCATYLIGRASSDRNSETQKLRVR